MSDDADSDDAAQAERRLSPVKAWLQAPKLWFRVRSDVLGRVYQVGVFARTMLGLHAVGVNLVLVAPRTKDPQIVFGACVVIIVWTAMVSVVLSKPQFRRTATFVLDSLVTLVVVLLTLVAVGPGRAPLSLAGYWMCGAPMYASIFCSTWTGVASSLALSVGLIIAPSHNTMERFGMAFVIVLLAGCVGILVEQFRATLVEQEQERIKIAALAERERLSRIVHDGALQVLALVEREGAMLGPAGARLAALARESETQLRVHLQDRDVTNVDNTDQADLASALDKYSSARITVSTMAGEVLVTRYLVEEVERALQEILKNVDRHAGDGAKAWILLDQEVDGEVVLFVRDNGVGMDARQARAASEQGHFGIRDSIIGRISAIGGSAILKSAPGAGTEWELRIPLDVQ